MNTQNNVPNSDVPSISEAKSPNELQINAPQVAAKPKPVLVICNQTNGIETRYVLEEGKEIVVGADHENPVFVEDSFISSKHFSLVLKGNVVEVKDLGSRNGLYLKLDKPSQLSLGDLLLAGKTVFKLEEEKNG